MESDASKGKRSLMCSIGGERTKAEELQKLIKLTGKGEMLEIV